MKFFRLLRALLAAIACLGLLFPLPAMDGAPPTGTSAARVETASAHPVVRDVALDAAGTLRGRVVDPEGRPHAHATLVVRQAGREVVQSSTDGEGRFAVSGLRGGIYQVGTTDGFVICRLWSGRAAPPAATDRLLVVAAPFVTRGQRPFSDLFVSNRFLIGVILAAAIAIPVGIHNSRSDQPSSS